MIRVTIVSSHHAMRVGLRELLNRQAGIRVTGEVLDFGDVNERETDVLVVASVSRARLFELTDVPFGFVLLTDDAEEVQILVDANPRAWGVLPSGVGGGELGAAVHGVGEGLWVGAPGLVRGLMRSLRQGDAGGEESLVESLTAREREVLQLMAEGLANKQIGLRLGISEHTVKFHLSSLYAKLNAASRTEAVKRGLGLGLISL